MIKQLARGLIYFEGKSLEDVKRVFLNFKFDEAQFLFFDKININQETLSMAGVFLNGGINEKYTSENVVRLFRKLMGLGTEKKNCDISVEREDEVEPLDNQIKYKFYFSFKIEKTETLLVSRKIEELLEGEYILKTRDVDYVNGKLFSKIELFSMEPLKEKVEKILISEKIFSDYKITINF